MVVSPFHTRTVTEERFKAIRSNILTIITPFLTLCDGLMSVYEVIGVLSPPGVSGRKTALAQPRPHNK